MIKKLISEIPYREKIAFYLRKILGLKTIIKAFFLLFISDAVLSITLGEHYDDSRPFLSFIIIVVSLYIIIGLGTHLALAVRKSRKYYLTGLIILSFAVLTAISTYVNDKLPSWLYLQN